MICLFVLLIGVGVEGSSPLRDLGVACAMCRRLSSGATPVSPLGLRKNGLPMAKGA